MYLRQVSGRGHRTQDPYGSALKALPLSYRQNGEHRKGRVFIKGAEL